MEISQFCHTLEIHAEKQKTDARRHEYHLCVPLRRRYVMAAILYVEQNKCAIQFDVPGIPGTGICCVVLDLFIPVVGHRGNHAILSIELKF